MLIRSNENLPLYLINHSLLDIRTISIPTGHLLKYLRIFGIVLLFKRI
jgi:hypothetical protein